MKKYISGGTYYSEKDIKSGEIFHVFDALDTTYTWDSGVALSRFLDELQNGKIIAKKCNSCKRILLPPRMFCEVCYRPTDEWVYVEDKGTVNTFAVCHVHWDASRVKEDETYPIPAVIEIDGATEGIGILHHIKEVDPENVEIGMRVQAVWKPEEERTGDIRDIEYFKPM